MPAAEGVRFDHDVVLGSTYVHCSCEHPPTLSPHPPKRLTTGLYVGIGGADTEFEQQGHFYFKFDTATQEGERIYCFETNMYFDYRDKREGDDGQVGA